MSRFEKLVSKQTHRLAWRQKLVPLLIAASIVASGIGVRIWHSHRQNDQKQMQGDLDRGLIRAIEKNATEEVSDFLAKGANVNAHLEGTEPLPDNFSTSNSSLLDRIRHLFRSKKEYKFVSKETALIVALNRVDNGQRASSIEAIVTSLVQAHADVNAEGDAEWVPLLYAVDAKQPHLVKLLLDHGANVNKEASYRGSALSLAAERGDAVSVSLLLQHGADVNAATESGWTPLMAGVQSWDEKTVSLLLKGGALQNSQNGTGKNAMSIAREQGRTSIIKLLLRYSTHPASKSNTHISQ